MIFLIMKPKKQPDAAAKAKRIEEVADFETPNGAATRIHRGVVTPTDAVKIVTAQFPIHQRSIRGKRAPQGPRSWYEEKMLPLIRKITSK